MFPECVKISAFYLRILFPRPFNDRGSGHPIGNLLRLITLNIGMRLIRTKLFAPLKRRVNHLLLKFVAASRCLKAHHRKRSLASSVLNT